MWGGRRTDGRTEKAGCRVACMRLKSTKKKTWPKTDRSSSKPAIASMPAAMVLMALWFTSSKILGSASCFVLIFKYETRGLMVIPCTKTVKSTTTIIERMKRPLSGNSCVMVMAKEKPTAPRNLKGYNLLFDIDKTKNRLHLAMTLALKCCLNRNRRKAILTRRSTWWWFPRWEWDRIAYNGWQKGTNLLWPRPGKGDKIRRTKAQSQRAKSEDECNCLCPGVQSRRTGKWSNRSQSTSSCWSIWWCSMTF